MPERSEWQVGNALALCPHRLAEPDVHEFDDAPDDEGCHAGERNERVIQRSRGARLR
jgi:hypothetical protein